MKKIIRDLLLCIIFIFILSTTVHAMNINIETNPRELKVGDEITVKVILDEPVVTSDFKLKYNKDEFKFIDSNTNYLNTKDYMNYGYVNSVYANTEGKTTKEFEFKFKAIKETEEATFEINEINCATAENKIYDDSNLDQDYKSEKVKVIVKSQEENNSGNDSNNSNNEKNDSNNGSNNDSKQNINGKTEDSTQANKVIPFAGRNTIVIISIILLIVLAIILKKKINWLSKVLPMFIAGIIVTSMYNINNSYAYTQTIKIFKFNINETENVYSILLNSIDTEKKVSVSELKDILKSITEIESKDNNILGDNEYVGTGYTIKLSDGSESKALVYGDCNGDGKVNSNDTYNMIQHMLEKEQLTGIYAKSVNLSNKDDQDDEKIDKEDIAKHISFLLGTLEGDFVEELPEEAKDLSQYIDVKFDNEEDEKLMEGDKCNFSIVLGEQTPKAHAKVTKVSGDEKEIISDENLTQTKEYQVSVEKNVSYEISVNISDDKDNVIHNVTRKLNMVSYFDTEEGSKEKSELEENAHKEYETLDEKLKESIRNIEDEYEQNINKLDKNMSELENSYKNDEDNLEKQRDSDMKSINDTYANTLTDINTRLEKKDIDEVTARDLTTEAESKRNEALQALDSRVNQSLTQIKESYQAQKEKIDKEREELSVRRSTEEKQITDEIEQQKEGIRSKLDNEIKEKENIIVVQKIK